MNEPGLRCQAISRPAASGDAQATAHGVAQARSLFDREILRLALGRVVPQARPPGPSQEPGDVRRPGRDGHHLHRGDRPPQLLRLGHHLLAVPHRHLRQLRRGHGRRPGQGPGRDAAANAFGDRGPPPERGRHREPGGRRRSRQGRPRRVRGGRPHPFGRGDHRRDRLGRRVGHNRRVGAGDPRVRGRPFRRHRRHEGALRPDRGPDHGRARAHLPRPDDRPGRGGQPPEDPQRDRPHDPAGRPDHRLLARGRGAAALRALRRHRQRGPRVYRSSSWCRCSFA